MMRKTRFTLVLALLLGACGQTDNGAPKETAPQQQAIEEKAEPVEAPVPEPTETNAANPMDTSAMPQPAQNIASNLIPPEFRGAWDYTQGTCADESDLRMEISANQIIFYESLGQVRSIEAKDEMTLDVTLAMEGEGEVWTTVTRLTLSDGGEILTPSAGPSEQAYEAMPRKKCPQ